MPNNEVTLNLGSGGSQIITETIAGQEMAVSKIHTGAANADGGPVAQTNPLFVELSDGTNAIGAAAHPVYVQGTLTANAGTNLNTSLLALESGGNLATIATNTGRIPAQGQALAAASLPVVLPAAQITTLTPPAAITGFALDTTLQGVLTISDFDTKAGSLTETAPATDTASSGLNGRLQRIAQRMTSLIALLPGSLGQKAKAASLAVTLASDQDALPVTGTFWQTTQPVSGTFWQATQPVSAASLPLPTGAATAAKQPALGTAGSASADVLSVQGVASMTALKVDGSAVTQPVSGTFWQATQPVSGTVTANAGTGNFTVAQATGTNLHTVVDSGTITTVSTVTAVTAITNALPAGTNLIGGTTDALRTDAIYNNTTSLTPKFAFATLSATGSVVALVSAKKLRVLRYSIMADAACSVYFRTITTTTQISGTKYLAANGGAGGTFSPVGHFETLAGEALGIFITGTANVSVDVTYVEV